MKRICVFCGSHAGDREEFAAAARELGTLLATRGWSLVFGGGHIGLMGVLADAVLQAGGKAIGVIPKALVEKELAHKGLTELHIVESMHQRKAVMADFTDAFAALPGGYGTADEFFEMLTWAQLGLHAKPIGVLNTAGFFDPLLAWLERAVQDGFIRPRHRRLLIECRSPEELLDRLGEAMAIKSTP